MDHIIKTIQPTKLDAAPTRDLEKMPVLSLREANSSGNGTAPGRPNLVSVSRAMQRIRRQIESVARLDAPILVLGENGT
ncbi:MAG TPA: hypothetical protein VFV92_11410, partial [Candidatus Bathyarchaeia archaeon]|nr:hypothetical protein [Candidatus Bathyarchaeia archaeon]